MRQTCNQVFGESLAHDGFVIDMGFEQLLANGAFQPFDARVSAQLGNVEEKLPRERVSVGVKPDRWQSDQKIAMLNGFSVEHARAVHDSHNETGPVIFAIRVESWHFRGFAADERASGLLAGAGDAFDDGNDDFGIELARGDVIHKKERPRSLDQYVVDAMIHEI